MQSRSEKVVARWKKRVTDLVSPEASKVLAACIPELKRILGVTAGSGAIDLGLNSSESTIRLKSILAMMFQTFVSKSKVSFTRGSADLKPCIIALDDLQWSSSTELNFLADFCSSRRVQNHPFVIIGAYRDNEVGEGHMLRVALEYMKLNSVRLYTVEVLPFTSQEMRELLFEILGGNDEVVPNVSSLAGLLLKKSKGNLFLFIEVCPLCCPVNNSCSSLFTSKSLCGSIWRPNYLRSTWRPLQWPIFPRTSNA
jgi:predicted ATPase